MKEYHDLLKLVLEKGRIKHNRTGVDTIGVFGAQQRFDLSKGFPLLTTKKVFWKGIVHELLWFLKGDTNIKYLVDNGVHIWDEWAYKKYLAQEVGAKITFSQKEFIETITSCDMEEGTTGRSFVDKYGDLGTGTYGGMWRAFPFHNELTHRSYGIDQISKVIGTLKTNPNDRRMIVSAWHPYWVDHCALPPCHVLFHFNTEELTVEEREVLLHKKLGITDGRHRCADVPLETVCDQCGIPKRRLNCLLYQRSCDLFLGVPFNIASYSLLLMMVAHCVNMEPGEFIHTYGDLHLYRNSIEAAKLQLSRAPLPLPTVKINNEVPNIFDFKYRDIELIGYESYPAIKVDVAV